MSRGFLHYGVIQYPGAKAGDSVRFVPGPQAGKPGAILLPRKPSEINAVLESVEKTKGLCRLKPQLQSAKAGAESGGATGMRIDLPVTAGGRLKVG